MKKILVLVLILAMASWGLSVPVRTSINVESDGTFERSSTAYLFDPSANTMTDIASGERRIVNVSITKPANMIIRTSEGGGSSSLRVMCNNGLYMFASDDTNNRIYRSLDGDTWVLVSPNVAVANTEFGVFGVMHALQSGRVIRTVPVDATWIIYYSDDNGDTWTAAKNADSLEDDFDCKAVIPAWGLARNATTGVYCATTYGNATTSCVIRTANNGTTWKLIVDGAGDADHLHAIAYHAGSNKWIYNTGDGYDDAFDFTSEDDGLTFTKWDDGFAYQYTQIKDVGDTDNVLLGTDAVGKVCWLNMTTGAVNHSLYSVDTRTTASKIFLIFEYANIYYACTWDERSSGSRDAIISVSSDLVNWRNYARFNDNTILGAYTYAGFFGGYLHLSATNTAAATNGWSHILLTPVTIESRPAILIEPACTNMFGGAAAANASDGESTTGWTNGGWTNTVGLDSTVKLHGSNSIKASQAEPALYNLATTRFVSTTVTNAAKYVARAYIKSIGGTRGSANFVPSYMKIGTEATYSYFTQGTDRWQPIISNIWTASGTDAVAVPTNIYGAPLKIDGTNYVVSWIDCAQFQVAPPSSWQIAGTDRASETWTNAIGVLQSDWTLCFTLITQFNSYQAGTSNLYLCTVKTSADDYLSVYWNVTDSKWYLDSVGTGSGNAVATTATGFQWEQQLTFVIRRSGAGVYLSVHDGRRWMHTISTADHTAGSTGTVTWQVGDITGANLMPELLTNIWYVKNIALGDSEIEVLPNNLPQSSGWLSR